MTQRGGTLREASNLDQEHNRGLAATCLQMVAFSPELLRYISFCGLCNEYAFLICETVHLNIGGIPMTFLKVNIFFRSDQKCSV